MTKSRPSLNGLVHADAAELRTVWLTLAGRWFPECSILQQYTINWSKRSQKRTLASCNPKYQRVIVARELNYSAYGQWLEPLLYHEMCHAVLACNDRKPRSVRRRWHGAEFRSLESKHHAIPAFNQWIKRGGWATAVRSDRAKRRTRRGLRPVPPLSQDAEIAPSVQEVRRLSPLWSWLSFCLKIKT